MNLVTTHPRVERETVGLIKAVVKSGYFRLEPEQKMQILSEISQQLATTYRVPTPNLRLTPSLGTILDNSEGAPLGAFTGDSNTIYLGTPSIVTFLHEFRHHIQYNQEGFELAEGIPDREVDAQGWAVCVYRQACPRMFRTAVENNRIMGVTLNDLD
jgi:hypothetical protein